MIMVITEQHSPYIRELRNKLDTFRFDVLFCK